MIGNQLLNLKIELTYLVTVKYCWYKSLVITYGLLLSSFSVSLLDSVSDISTIQIICMTKSCVITNPFHANAPFVYPSPPPLKWFKCWKLHSLIVSRVVFLSFLFFWTLNFSEMFNGKKFSVFVLWIVKLDSHKFRCFLSLLFREKILVLQKKMQKICGFSNTRILLKK